MAMSRSRVERLRKEHERKMITRIIFFISLIILMLVLLVWYAVPAFVSIANIWLQVKELDKVTSSNRTVVLTEPSLEKASRELSKESKTSIKGSTDSGSRVYLMVNEQANGDVIADGDGFFEFNDVALKEGENLVYVYRKDERGNKSNPSRSVTIVVDTQAPSIEVSKPFSGESFTGQSRRTIDVEGTASGADFVFVMFYYFD